MSESSAEQYREAEAALLQVAAAIQRQGRVDLAPVVQCADRIVAALYADDQLVVEALSSPAGAPLVTNLINVGILCTKVGMGLGYYGAELHRLALAGLVHDIGIFAVPQQLLTQSRRLSPEERVLVEQHPRLGSALIQDLGPEYAWLSDVVLHAHERGQGQGYPHRLRGREINELAQIIGLVDIFDALVSPRPYRRRLLPHEAIRELLTHERLSFPREIIKGLVEQLAVYPLGTTVRVSSGEEGVVVRITPAYPARPVVRMSGEQNHAAPRYLDLSRLPHLSVVDAVESPMREPMRHPTAPHPHTTPSSTAETSDQFTALLEGLDAVAGVIQRALDRAPDQRDSVGSSPPEQAVTEPLPVRREVLGLFLLEAREWLNQIQTALERLDTTGEQPRRAKLTSILCHSVNNLARAARTVGLTAVESMAVTLLPTLQAAGRQERSVVAHHVATLREGLLRLARTVQELDATEAPGSFAAGVDSAEAGVPASRSDSESNRAVPLDAVEGRSRQDAPDSILDALRRLHLAKGRSVQPVRDVLETVIQRAERAAHGQTEVVDARAVGRILNELDALDEHFVAQVERHAPTLSQALHRIGAMDRGAALTSDLIEPLLTHIETLLHSAEQVSAANITLLLHGLRRFLRMTAQESPAVMVERVNAVEARVAALVPMAQQWVDIGRVERMAIFDILPMA